MSSLIASWKTNKVKKNYKGLCIINFKELTTFSFGKSTNNWALYYWYIVLQLQLTNADLRVHRFLIPWMNPQIFKRKSPDEQKCIHLVGNGFRTIEPSVGKYKPIWSAVYVVYIVNVASHETTRDVGVLYVCCLLIAVLNFWNVRLLSPNPDAASVISHGWSECVRIIEAGVLRQW